MPRRAWNELLPAVERLIELAERVLDDPAPEAGASHTKDSLAYRWRRGRLEPIGFPDLFPLDVLIGVERSLEKLRANAEAFTSGRPALDVLLYGERGTGKSSAVKGLLARFGDRGLRMIEVHKADLIQLPRVVGALREAPYRFVLFCDDLSFDAGEARYRELKAALEGFWAGRLTAADLDAAAKAIRAANWRLQAELGIAHIPSNDFSLYDQVLDTAAMVGAVPKRFGWDGGAVGPDTLFAMARGTQDAA